MKKTVLSFGAHPDDIELGCGGTESLLIQRGYEVTHAILTSGESGSREYSPADLGRIREAEAIESARVLGVQHVEFLRYPDGFTHYTRAMKVELIRLIRRVRPEIVFVHSRDDLFPDHRVAREMVLAAIEGASGPWYFEVSEEPYAVPRIMGYEVWTPIPAPQAFSDITAFASKKTEALRAHRTQMSSMAYEEAAMGLSRYRGVMSRAGRYAEAFEIIADRGIFPPESLRSL